jgi:hypothetical protein
MVPYIMVNADGWYVGGGQAVNEGDRVVPELEEGVQIIWGVEPPTGYFRKWKFENGELIDHGSAVTYGYDILRAQNYPLIGDQLDAIWKALNGDTTEAAELYERILTVKNLFPKPDEEISTDPEEQPEDAEISVDSEEQPEPS